MSFFLEWKNQFMINMELPCADVFNRVIYLILLYYLLSTLWAIYICIKLECYIVFVRGY